MALSNDMTLLLNKCENRLGLAPLVPHLPEWANKEKWGQIVMTDTIVTFSRYYPNRLRMIINDTTVDKKMVDNTMWYYIKDEVLQGAKLLGIMDIDWMDYTTNNSSLGATSMGGGYYYPSFACPTATFENILALQMNADMSSLYNRGLYIDFEYPNRFALKGMGNTNYDLNSFTVILLVQHSSLSTISPTMMETFESLAFADIANFLALNLRYFDGLETVFVNVDLKLSELQDVANKRTDIIEKLENSYVSTSNKNIPYIWTV